MSHRASNDWARANALQETVIQDPGASGTFNLEGNFWSRVTLTATGTYTLPSQDAGTQLLVCVDDTSTITLADAGGTVAVFVGTSGTSAARCTATDDNSWAVEIVGVTSGGANEIGIADAGGYTANTTVETVLQELLARATVNGEGTNTAITTVGAGALTAAAIIGGVITRSGSTAAYTDTTNTGTQIVTALGTGAVVGTSWLLFIKNTVAFAQTLAAGTDVVLAGQSIVPPNSTGVFFCKYSDINTVDITGLGSYPQATLPNGQYNTTAAASPVTPAAGILTGANNVFYEITTDGAFGITTRTATQLFGDIPNCHVGFTYLLTIVNRGNNTVTITDGGSVTITASENTLATLVTRTYLVRFTSATACTWTSLSKGTIET